MNKTISINISGLIFNIEEEAYEVLRKYLDDIKAHFKDIDECREIMADIESRIAELFTSKLSDSKTVINMEDVKGVIAVMGSPDDYVDDVEEEEKAKFDNPQYQKSKTRRMYRDPDNKVLGGVCSGISHYFGWDPIWLRIALILFTIAFGSGVFIYIILWVIIPKAVTNAQKLEMKGEKVNVENIGKMASEGGEKVKDGFNKFKKNLDQLDTKDLSSQLEKFLLAFIEILKGALKLVVKVVGFAFITASVIILVVFLGFLIGKFPFTLFSGSDNISLYHFGELIFPSTAYLNIATIGVAFLTIIPITLILYLGIKLLFNFKDNFRYVAVVLVGLWILGIIVVSIIGISIGTEFASEKKIKQTLVLDSLKSDTLYLDVFTDPHFSDYLDNNNDFLFELITTGDDSIFVGNPYLDIRASSTPYFMIETQKIAHASTQKEAIYNAENINFSFEQIDSLARFNPYFSFAKDDKFRGQHVKVIVRVPEGKTVYLSPNSKRIIYDIDNVTNTYDNDMVDNFWTMTPEGLECIDCDLEENRRYRRRRNKRRHRVRIEVDEK